MDILFNLLIIGLIIVLWALSNTFNKPVLNRMMNYYEDDTEGRQAANIFIAFMLVLAFILGSRMY